MDCQQLRLRVIRPVLQDLHLWSQSAENLLLGTAAQESLLGYYLCQKRGPALGIFQMEPATHKDIWERFMPSRSQTLRRKVQALARARWAGLRYPPAQEMVVNLAYATALARLHYLRVPSPLPAADDLDALAAYWKRHFNTRRGRGTRAQFVENYGRFVV